MQNEQEFLSPAQVATLKSVSRPTVSRALKSGDLRGIRDNSGRWKISTRDAEDWLSSTSGTAKTVHEQRARSEHAQQIEQLRTELATTREELASTRTRAEILAEQLQDLREERERWRGLAEQLSEPRPVARSWLDRLLGRA